MPMSFVMSNNVEHSSIIIIIIIIIKKIIIISPRIWFRSLKST